MKKLGVGKRDWRKIKVKSAQSKNPCNRDQEGQKAPRP